MLHLPQRAQQRGTQPLCLVNPLSHCTDVFKEEAVTQLKLVRRFRLDFRLSLNSFQQRTGREEAAKSSQGPAQTAAASGLL